MKKLLVFIVSFMLMPIISLAVNYDITHYYINADVLENGDMEVSELIVLKGSFNGYERDILYGSSNFMASASGLDDIEVYGKYVDDVSMDSFLDSYDLFERVSNANNGDKGKYIVSFLPNGYRLRMHYATTRGQTAFLIKYTLKNVVVLHDEFAEVYWNFIGSDFEDKIHDLKIKVNLPDFDESDYFRIWAHGEMSGEVRFDNTYTSSLLAEAKIVSERTPTDVRLTFSKDLIDEDRIKKKSDVSLDSIIADETKLADEQNELRAMVKFKYYLVVGALVLFYAYTIIMALYIYFKYDKERKAKFNMEYNREFIDDYNVEVVDYLMTKKVSDKALSASILNLIYKKNITCEKLEEGKNSYKFTLKNRDNLNKTENALVDFLFNKVGSYDVFTTAQLKKYASGTKTCQTFMNTYNAWKNMVIKDGEEQEFFEKYKGYVGLAFVSVGLGILICFFSLMNNIDIFLSKISWFVGVCFCVYTALLTKKTKKGIEHYAKWMAFKRFLRDFGNFSAKELPEIILWERYLVYAAVFGLADQVEKVMKVKIKEINVDDSTYYTYGFHDYLFDLHISNCINSVVSSAINSSQATINRINAESMSSSGSGFGGGFSSGGGFGGGGGGGRGF